MTKKINNQYHVECSVYSNSRNWGHKIVLYKDYMPIDKETITYQNRTWERYQFESILIKMAYKLDKEYKNDIPLRDRVTFYNNITA